MTVVIVIAAAAMGSAAGWVCGLVPVWPFVRVLAASVLGASVGLGSVVALMFIALARAGGSGGLGAASMGVSEAAIAGLGLALLGPAGYVALTSFGRASDAVATYGPIVSGGGVALVTALWLSRGMSVVAGP